MCTINLPADFAEQWAYLYTCLAVVSERLHGQAQELCPSPDCLGMNFVFSHQSVMYFI